MKDHALTIKMGFQHAVGLDWNMIGRCWGETKTGQCNDVADVEMNAHVDIDSDNSDKDSDVSDVNDKDSHAID